MYILGIVVSYLGTNNRIELGTLVLIILATGTVHIHIHSRNKV